MATAELWQGMSLQSRCVAVGVSADGASWVEAAERGVEIWNGNHFVTEGVSP